MVEYLYVAGERVCIRCVGESRGPLAGPGLAGAAAVLRTLGREAELEWRAQWGRPFLDRRRLDAILETADVVLWSITPPNLRTPNAVALNERMLGEVITAFDRIWALRSTPARSLMDVFCWWRKSQARALRYAELEMVDRRYAALIESESAAH